MIDPGALLGPLWTLLAFVGLGWLAARRLAIDPRPIATLLIYLIAPLTFFRGLLLGGPTPHYLLLTLALFLLASLVAAVVNPLAQRFLSPQESAVLAFSSGTGNTGYFGLPIAMILLPAEGVTLYLFCILGVTLYEFTVGFYLSARGRFSVRESLAKIVRLPLIYAFLAALLVSGLGISPPDALMESLAVFPATYTLLGMMIIGMTLGRVAIREIDLRFMAGCVAIRYLLWPWMMLAVVWLLQALLPLADELALALLLLGVVPMAANVVVVAMELGIQPAKGALAVLVTTLAAPLLIPLYLGLLMPLAGL
ncbi:AEC family transporter [Halomonas sp. MCCC 1A17488]|uniref:AEC family transporter n=1 Tax=Billgrantia sulfidoxydans TaxID=2733484 RepID=A0ABX7VYY4_9GAMM|nr:MULTISPECIES: AEC family transporter [Halomonas]MCE8016859.1 AEC family transporter [Halomonas sp. MCCC 1A17488]MCG3240192.1 AEC family transporter [Halomonas sp. MCCC 1A17488]QPP49931.1 AEC family transporter [Halomonas sp. SS10-MC5]QTP53544.1 AEC family transporter [Halomonas sulfidoxydans]